MTGYTPYHGNTLSINIHGQEMTNMTALFIDVGCSECIIHTMWNLPYTITHTRVLETGTNRQTH